MPTLDKGWLIADVVTDTALFALGVNEIALVSGMELPTAASTFGDLTRLLKLAAGLLSGTASTGTRSAEVALELVEAFKKGSIRIPAGDSANVWEQGLLTTLFKPSSGWFGMAGYATVDLTIVTEDGKLTAEVDSSPDQSWIATGEGIVRSVYGTINDVDPQAEVIAWSAGASAGAGTGDEGALGETADLPVEAA
ncbi:hypothetical protein ACFWAR_01025 [Streptomyces sp. NPDC059917]|uniref:hypothetical protein n=1 Tax=Streptomyces sp. NPDC059917 TaxID=3347002 RepID=UPI0036680E8D